MRERKNEIEIEKKEREKGERGEILGVIVRSREDWKGRSKKGRKKEGEGDSMKGRVIILQEREKREKRRERREREERFRKNRRM